jgi:hypothetical protein
MDSWQENTKRDTLETSGMLKGMEINGTKLFGYVHGTEQQELHKIHQ